MKNFTNEIVTIVKTFLLILSEGAVTANEHNESEKCRLLVFQTIDLAFGKYDRRERMIEFLYVR